MNRKIVIAMLSLVLSLPALAVAEPVVYKVDSVHSGVGFTIRHFVTNTPGRFRDFDGTIRYDKQNPAASNVEFTVRTDSIDTDNDDRDKHLKSPDFFDVAKFPTMTFTSTAVKAKDADTLEVTGDLTMHGVTKRVTIPVEVLGTARTPQGEKAGFETSFTVNRKEYGLEWNRVVEGTSVLGDDVKVNVQIEANREAAPAK